MGGGGERTTVGLQVEKLVESPEKAYKAAMREAYKTIGSGMKGVMRTYQRNIIDGKSLFNDNYLTALGYNPRETIKYGVVDPALVLDWCRNNINSNISSVESYSWKIPTIEEICLEYLQDTYGNINFSDKSFNISGVKWFVTGTVVVGDNSSNATLLKNKETTVAEYASLIEVSVVSIANGLINQNGVNYWSAVLSNGPRLVPAVYMTVVCPGVSSGVVSTILASYSNREYDMFLNDEYDNTIWSNTIVINTYVNSGGYIEVTGSYKKPNIVDGWGAQVYVESTQDAMRTKLAEVQQEIKLLLLDGLDRLVAKYSIYGTSKIVIAEINKDLVSAESNAKCFPVIPLKENYSILNSTTNMKAVMNKLGMATSDFEDSIGDGRLKNAAIMFIVDLEDTSEVGIKLIYETLVGMVATTIPASGKISAYEAYQLNLGFSDINMKTEIKMNISYHEGSVTTIGKYLRYSETYTEPVLNSETNLYENVAYTIKGIRKQINELYYEQIELSGNTKFEIGGYQLEDKVYIPITDIGLAKLTYEESTYAVSLSMNIVLVSVVVTKTKWYQSGFFKFVLLIVLIVITYLSFGTTSQYTVPAMAALMGTTIATATTVFTVIVVITTTVAVLGIMGVDTGVWGDVAAVLGIGTAAIGAYGNIGAMTMQQTVLTSAKTLVNLASMAIDINTKGVIRSIEGKMEQLNAELKASEEQLNEAMNNIQQGLWVGVVDREPDMLYAMSSTSMMCNYSILYDYDGMYDSKINSVGI